MLYESIHRNRPNSPVQVRADAPTSGWPHSCPV
uniref:Uncharacterized protein n=1 Tax=Arundo donax TaxID=35708 RepID=A0A0A9BDC0_ARUDO